MFAILKQWIDLVNQSDLFTVTYMPEAQGRRPTLVDVAREAGVSHMTVSRVVRGLKNVRTDTRLQVEAAIQRLGYRPDPALSALAQYRQPNGARGDGGVLVFLDCDQSSYSQTVLNGAQSEVQQLGYLIEHRVAPKNAAAQRQLNRALFHRGVRGLLFGPSNEEWDFRDWNWPEFAAVSLGALGHQPAMHGVAADYFDAACSATHRLREEGAQRIGFAVLPELEARTGHRWLGGYRAGIGKQRAYEFSGGLDPKKLKAWVKRHQIDALLTIHTDLAKAWPSSEQRVVLLNSEQEGVNESWRFIRLDPRQIGEEGVRLLHHLLLRREYGLPQEPKMVALRGAWQGGET